MTITLELNESEEEQVRVRAAQLGIDEADYIRRLIKTDYPGTALPAMTPAEIVEYWKREGVLGTFADRADSPELARELRRNASHRS